jgi:hypothetical protein
MQGYQPPHVANHEAGGIDPLALANIAGQIAAAQHPAGLGANLHHPQIHGAVDHTDRTRSIWLPPQCFTAVEGAPALTQYGVFPASYVGWAFDPGAREAVLAEMSFPADYVFDILSETITVFWTRNAAGAGNVRWEKYFASVPTDNLIGWHGAIATQAVPAQDVLASFTEGLGMLNGARTGDIFCKIGIRRDGLAGADTFPADIVFLGACLNYLADM